MMVIYLHAVALTKLLGAAVSIPNAWVLPVSGAQTAAAAATTKKSAQPILARNLFDSATGPLDRVPKPEAGRSIPLDPLLASACDNTKLLIVTESPDPTWSSATLKGPGETAPRLRRVGDNISGGQVAFIGYNPKLQQPAVWLTTHNGVCQSPLFHPLPPLDTATNLPATTGSNPASNALATQARVERSNEAGQSEFAKLLRSVRIAPEFRDGRATGLRVSGIRTESLLDRLGLHNGDVLETINGYSIANPERALEAYVRLRSAESLSVQLVRLGRPMTIDYRIR